MTTFGESHGVAIGCVIDGCPPGLGLTERDIQRDMDRRRPGTSAVTTKRQEADRVEMLSGVFEGVTTGTPIGLLVRNTDQRSGDYEAIKHQIRPSHADYTYLQKYGLRDYRGGGRASARETAMRVAAGAVARKYLHERLQVRIRARLSQIGGIVLGADDWGAVDQNPFFCAEPTRLGELERLIAELRQQGDSVGAEICLEASGLPVGLGEPVFDKLDAVLAGALMSINAVRAVGFGEGFDAARARGSDYRDEIDRDGFLSNTAGGTLGGISSGQPLIARVVFKPTSSIAVTGSSLDTSGAEVAVSTGGRHDPCVGLRAVPIVEAMAALTLMDLWLRHRGQCADVEPPMAEIEQQ